MSRVARRRPRSFLWDLVAVAALVTLVNASVFVPALAETPLRVPLGFAFGLFLPGYALVAAVFPRRDDETYATVPLTESNQGLGPAERIGSSVGFSVAVVGLCSLALSEVGVGVALDTVMLTVSAVTGVLLVTAAVRRTRTDPEQRYVPSLSLPRLTDEGGPTVSHSTGVVLNVALVASILLAGTAGAMALVGPGSGDGFSELYLLTEAGDGDLVAADYPTEFAPGESREVVVGVDNHEQTTTAYTVVVQAQRTEQADGSVTVLARERLVSFRRTIEPGQTARRTVSLSPAITADDRITVLLYRGDPPARPTIESAAISTRLNVSVSGE